MAGDGPSEEDGTYRLLDQNATPGQSNAVAFDLAQEGEYERLTLRCQLRVLQGGEGGAFVLLATSEYGKRGPAPFVKSWVEPNLNNTFAIGIDVHDPPNHDPFGSGGNYQGLPEREVSLHWDRREIVKRVAPAEFRGGFTRCEITVQHVIGGAEVTVRLSGETIYDRYFVAGMLPYESRLAIGAGTREDTATEFDVEDLEFTKAEPVADRRPPKHFEVFNHVRTNRSAPSHEKMINLPPLEWAYGRVILTLEIHDAGREWDPWDRNGHFYVIRPDGRKYDISPFITSFRTPGLWKVDVTHFRPWLTGRVKFQIATTSDPDSDRGYLMSAALDFYPGVPALEPYRVVPLWNGLAKYKSADNHFRDFFSPQGVHIDTETEAARLLIMTSGHTPVGEFTPSRRTVFFVPESARGDIAQELRFENTLWRADGYLNPVRPQRGSWKYARAGWAPGDVVRPWEIDLTPHIDPGKTAVLSYEPEPYDFSDVPEDQRPSDTEVNQAVHLVRSYLVLYRPPGHVVPAPSLEVLAVEEGSNASKGGIEAGDYLLTYDGNRLKSIEGLQEAIRTAEAEDRERVRLLVYRGTERLELELRPGRMGVRIAEE